MEGSMMPYSDKDMWGRVCRLRNKQRCINEYDIPKGVVYHPVVIVGRRLTGTYQCMLVSCVDLEIAQSRISHILRSQPNRSISPHLYRSHRHQKGRLAPNYTCVPLAGSKTDFGQ